MEDISSNDHFSEPCVLIEASPTANFDGPLSHDPLFHINEKSIEAKSIHEEVLTMSHCIVEENLVTGSCLDLKAGCLHNPDAMIEEKDHELLIEAENETKTPEETVYIKENEGFLEEEVLMNNQKDIKEDITQDSSRDGFKGGEEEEKHEAPCKELKKTGSSISGKASQLRKNIRERKAPVYFEDENSNLLIHDEKEVVQKIDLRKIQQKKHNVKNYDELVSAFNQLSKYEWFESSSLSHKLLGSQILTPTVIWWMTNAKYFPRAPFLGNNIEKSIHKNLEKLKTWLPEIPERITKDLMKVEIAPDSQANFFDWESNREDVQNYLNKNNHERSWTPSSAEEIHSQVKQSYTIEDDEWIAKTRGYIYDCGTKFLPTNENSSMEIENKIGENPSYFSKLELDSLIKLYERDLNETGFENNQQMQSFEKLIIQKVVEEEPINRLKYDLDNSIVDLKFYFPEDEIFLAYLEKKQNEGRDQNKISTQGATAGKSASKFKERIQPDDMVCYVCNDGDYTDDDLIVFCSRCNMSVHQDCYGIPVIPEGDWICDVCLNFEENGKYLRCPMCDKRGGALKPSQLRADTDLFETTNPGYHAFLKSYATTEFMKAGAKTKYLSIKDIKQPKKKDEQQDEEDEEKEESNDENVEEQLYYDIQFLDDNFTEEELVNEPKPAHVWTHLSCVLFLPELYFLDQTYVTNIAGFENLPKDRFKFDCEVCQKKRNGCIVNCEKGTCKKAFHPECARRANHFLEMRENETGQMVYHLFCEKHTPLKLRRTLEGKEKKMKEEINKFFKAAEKYCMIMAGDKLPNAAAGGETTLDPTLRIRKYEKNTEISDFLSLVEKYKKITAEKQCTIVLEKVESEEPDELLFNLVNVTLPKLNFTKNRKLTADDEIWNIMPYKDLTAEQKYNRYRKILMKLRKKTKAGGESKIDIMRKNMEKARQIKKERALKAEKEGKETKKVTTKKKTTKSNEYDGEEDPNKLYCLCRKKYGGEAMIECNCKEWYHPKCLSFPGKKFPDLSKIKLFCKKCCKKRGDKEYELVVEEKKDGKTMIYKRRPGETRFEKYEPSLTKKLKK